MEPPLQLLLSLTESLSSLFICPTTTLALCRFQSQQAAGSSSQRKRHTVHYVHSTKRQTYTARDELLKIWCII